MVVLIVVVVVVAVVAVAGLGIEMLLERANSEFCTVQRLEYRMVG